MSLRDSSYRGITKAFGIFGGVQVISIIVLLIRSKIIALYLGPSGLGISTLFNSTLTMVGSIAGLGIAFSAVRDIAESKSTDNDFLISQTITVFRKWIWVTGFLGVIIVLFFAKPLSLWTFNSADYTWSFVILAISLLLTSYSNGQKSILQGLGQLKKMANMTVWTSLLGLITLPLYFFYGNKGIVPAIVVTSFITALVSKFFSKDIKINSVKLSNHQAFKLGTNMIKIGLLVTLSGLLYTLWTNVLNIFINKLNGPDDVGLYQAGWMITNQSVGLIFTAMGVDYYPRLAAINSNNKKITVQVNQQSEIMLLIIGVLISLLLVFVPFIIKILLTDSFLVISNFIRLTALGILFKAIHWCLGYVILAKGDTRLYMVSEFLGISMMFLFYITGYYFSGVDGIGYAYILSYVFFLVIYYSILKRKYEFTFSKSAIKISIIMITFCTLIYLLSLFYDGTILVLLELLLCLIIIIFALFELNKRLQLVDFIKQFVKEIK